MDFSSDRNEPSHKISENLLNSDSESSSQSLSKEDVHENFCEEGLSICASFKESSNHIENSIFSLLSKIFQEEILRDSDFQFLTDTALSYIREILKKKFTFGSNFKNFELIKARRRNEEQFKFVVKKGFKRLFKNFKKMKRGFIKGDKLLDELEFYRFYFLETCNSDRTQFEGFLLPGSKIQKEFTNPQTKMDKTVSFVYLIRIFKSESFKRDFISYLLNDFVGEYVTIRNLKLMKLAIHFTGKKKVKTNKLPWTQSELFEAQKCFVNLIYSFGNWSST